MKNQSGQDFHRFQVEVRYYANSYYIKRVAKLQRALEKQPGVLRIEIVGVGEIPADAALRFRAVLLERMSATRILTHAHSSLQNSSVLLWLLGDRRTIREDARLFFRPTTLSEDAMETHETGNGVWKPDEAEFENACAEIDAEEGDYARVLQLIDEFLPVKEMAGRLIGVPVLRQFGLINNEKLEEFLTAAFSPGSERNESAWSAWWRKRLSRPLKK